MSITLLIVDDHEMVREGLRYAFSGTGIEVIEASDGGTGLTLVFDEEVDIVLLDVDMPGLDALEVLDRIKQQEPDLPVLMHSCHDRFTYVERSIELGAAGYIIKGPNKTKVIDAVRIASAGGSV